MDSARQIAERIPTEVDPDRRFIIAIAGPPASGKSTLAASLVDRLGGRAGLLAMDGFHFDNNILDARGHRDRKGAPHTFDVAGYATMLASLRAQPRAEMAVPVFDRDHDLARSCASLITTEHDLIVTEGNYLLMGAQPWADLHGLFDLTVWIDVDLETIEERIRQRWVDFGLPATEIERRTTHNDLPNARTVEAGSVAADVVVSHADR